MTDPVTHALLHGRLARIAPEMDAVLIREAFSPAMAVGREVAHGLYDPVTGEALVQGGDDPFLLGGATPSAVRSVIAAAATAGGPQDGDLWICNDPWIAGPHHAAVRLARPVFHQGEPVCWLVSAGRWDEIGGARPGHGNPSATDGLAEGLLIPPTRLAAAGRACEEIAQLIFANLEEPARAEADFRAHRSALAHGAKRLLALLDSHGRSTIQGALSEERDRAARQFGAQLAEWPSGTASIDDALDNDGLTDDLLPIALDLTLDGETLTLDFSRSAPAVRGPMNLSQAATRAVCGLALRRICGESAGMAGALDRVKIVIRDGSVLDARRPAPLGGNGETALRVGDVIRRALAALAPDRLAACDAGTMSTFTLAGFRAGGEAWTMVSAFSGGAGAVASADGGTGVGGHPSPAAMPPLEIVEARYPVKIRKFLLRPDSCGPGLRRGGPGALCEIELLDTAAEGFWLADRATTPPPGVAEGRPAVPGGFRYNTDTGPALASLHSKEARIRLRRGQAVRLETPGGGGHGDPFDRDPEAVAQDAVLGLVGLAAARRDYGVALGGDGRVDAMATAALRSGSGERHFEATAVDGAEAMIALPAVAALIEEMTAPEEPEPEEPPAETAVVGAEPEEDDPGPVDHPEEVTEPAEEPEGPAAVEPAVAPEEEDPGPADHPEEATEPVEAPEEPAVVEASQIDTAETEAEQDPSTAAAPTEELSIREPEEESPEEPSVISAPTGPPESGDAPAPAEQRQDEAPEIRTSAEPLEDDADDAADPDPFEQDFAALLAEDLAEEKRS